MRVFLDTNVWIAAFLTHGSCAELLEHCLKNHILLTSKHVLQEIDKNLSKKFSFPSKKIKEILLFIQQPSTLVESTRLEKPTCRDPDDDWILAGIVSGNADCLLTGDKDLLILNTFQNIPILKPAQFWLFEKEKKI